jgi:hypothetical protein
MKICERTGKPIVELSHSGLNSFNSCPKRFAFRKMIISFDEDRGESDAAAVGTAMHDGIQEYMRSRNLGRALEALAASHPIELTSNSPKPHEYSLEASVWTLEHIINDSELPAYSLVNFIRDGKEVPATEIAFMVEIEFPTLMFHLRGFVDLIVQNPDNGLFLPIDIKTTTPQGSTHMHEKYRWDWQVTSYGIPLNILLENHGAFETGIFGVIMSDREPRTIFPRHTRSQHDIEAYNFYLLDNCRRIEQYYRSDVFPRNPSSCVSWGRVCPYLTQCAVTGLEPMQNIINPSRKPGKAHRELDPIFTIRMEGMEA